MLDSLQIQYFFSSLFKLCSVCLFLSRFFRLLLFNLYLFFSLLLFFEKKLMGSLSFFRSCLLSYYYVKCRSYRFGSLNAIHETILIEHITLNFMLNDSNFARSNCSNIEDVKSFRFGYWTGTIEFSM